MPQGNKHIKHVVFDLDWTLYNGTAYFHQAWSYLAGEIASTSGISHALLEAKLVSIWTENGPSGANLFNLWLDEFNLSHELIPKLIKELHSEWPLQISLYEGVLKMLTYLKKSNIRVSLLTEGKVFTQQRKIDLLNLREHLDSIYITEEIGSSKKTGIPFDKVIADSPFMNHEILMIGDHPLKDVQIALDKGASAVQLYQGPHATKKVENALVFDTTKEFCVEVLKGDLI